MTRRNRAVKNPSPRQRLSSQGEHLVGNLSRSAARFQQPTQALEQVINGDRPAAVAADMVEMQGGEPVKVAGAGGAVGVSGFNKDKDVQVAQEASGKVQPQGRA